MRAAAKGAATGAATTATVTGASLGACAEAVPPGASSDAAGTRGSSGSGLVRACAGASAGASKRLGPSWSEKSSSSYSSSTRHTLCEPSDSRCSQPAGETTQPGKRRSRESSAPPPSAVCRTTPDFVRSRFDPGRRSDHLCRLNPSCGDRIRGPELNPSSSGEAVDRWCAPSACDGNMGAEPHSIPPLRTGVARFS